MENKLNDVVITKPMVGICGMQVCAKKGVSDESILMVCNSENPSGTANGWSRVIRNIEKGMERGAPVQCDADLEREHLIVVC